MKPFYNIRRECFSISSYRSTIKLYRSLDTALEDDEAAVRVLNNNIDANGTGFSISSNVTYLLSHNVGKSYSRWYGRLLGTI